MSTSAQADVYATAMEMDGDVVFSAEGSLNLAAWTFDQEIEDFARINPSSPIVVIGPTPSVACDIYMPPDTFEPPENFGMGGDAYATSGDGDLCGFRAAGGVPLVVPAGYVSGDPLAGSAFYEGASLESLGMEIGVYVWFWGEGDTADTFTLEVSIVTSNEQSTWSEIKSLYR